MNEARIRKILSDVIKKGYEADEEFMNYIIHSIKISDEEILELGIPYDDDYERSWGSRKEDDE